MASAKMNRVRDEAAKGTLRRARIQEYIHTYNAIQWTNNCYQSLGSVELMGGIPIGRRVVSMVEIDRHWAESQLDSERRGILLANKRIQLTARRPRRLILSRALWIIQEWGGAAKNKPISPVKSLRHSNSYIAALSIFPSMVEGILPVRHESDAGMAVETYGTRRGS